MSDMGKQADSPINYDGGGCELSGRDRGDCFNAVGLPGETVPDQHDGPDDTVDVYGRPNGWCWQCWKSHQIDELQCIKADLLEALKELAACEHDPKYARQVQKAGHVIAKAKPV